MHKKVLLKYVYRSRINTEHFTRLLIIERYLCLRCVWVLGVANRTNNVDLQDGSRLLTLIDTFVHRQHRAVVTEIADELKLNVVEVCDTGID